MDAQAESQAAKDLLTNTYEHQQRAEELLADLDKAKASADRARNQSENTYKEAQKIYNTLQGLEKVCPAT